MKEKRNLSGIYFRTKNEDTGKIENRVFEDLSETEQNEILEVKSEMWLRGLAKNLADTLNAVGEKFDIKAK